MRAADIRIASELLMGLDELGNVRNGLRTSDARLEVGAFVGDHEGGTGHGSAFLPFAVADEVLDAVEKILRDNLKELGIEVEARPKGS